VLLAIWLPRTVETAIPVAASGPKLVTETV
jgi:hypothetical protein